ncbi:IS200/IS605 family transposase [Cesiribacter andamanensis]|uniref:Transposase n=1 Tax=Cesiribacter andamanensis AMV16 TaxID=1279009 RepID=M7N0V3_9BACT|nr:IS200/IS605 family transposase [Cesiribacter andamanensis]EMR00831.1 Transposase [Cesiribacter andamanensis AMV16]
MPRSFTQVYVHVVWAVKNREKILSKTIRYKLIEHILETFKERKLVILALGGVEDHMHCLLRLPATYTIAQAVKEIKGESSHWLNATNQLEGSFIWQEGYGAFSVSPQRVEQIKTYVFNQEQHHQTVSIDQELSVFGL